VNWVHVPKDFKLSECVCVDVYKVTTADVGSHINRRLSLISPCRSSHPSS
jgi:hypothetical protein